MGGKNKQRVKNNAKPSSSSQSADQIHTRKLQGFAGFDRFTDMGVMVIPGFSLDTEKLDSINPEFQLVFKKITKKDPVTKKKALNELIELVNSSDMENNQNVLPLWPRYYKNLATDPDHGVRELAQMALRALMLKFKRAMAPYLKQIVPFWLLSFFDSYSPAASNALTAFKETFVGSTDRTEEVLLHCHKEILDHAIHALTNCSVSTISSGKDIAPEEAEQKYQHLVVGSLKSMSLLVQKTGDSANSQEIASSLTNLIEQQKFWSFSKSKNTTIKAAWLDFIYQLLQSSCYKNIIDIKKCNLTTLSFQNVDDFNAAVADNAWAVFLSIQSGCNDWYSLIDFPKVLQPKLFALLRNRFNGNAVILCPHLWPFLSKITPDIPDFMYKDFCEKFFEEFKSSICSEKFAPKSEINAMIKSFFECLRCVLQFLNGAKNFNDAEHLSNWLLRSNVMTMLKWFFDGNGSSSKCYFQNLASIVAFWAESTKNSTDPTLSANMLSQFWQLTDEAIANAVDAKDVTALSIERIVEFLQQLHASKSSIETQNIKFSKEISPQESRLSNSNAKKHAQPNQLLSEKLKQLVADVIRRLIRNIHSYDNVNINCVLHQVHSLTRLFKDSDFHKRLCDEGTNKGTLQVFENLFQFVQTDLNASELVVEIIFEILLNMEAKETAPYITELMTKEMHENLKALILQRLLSYPFCQEAFVPAVIATPQTRSTIINMAKAVAHEFDTPKFNILHKCFFQNENGKILIDRLTVEGILDVLCKALIHSKTKEFILACSSFFAQNMAIICTEEYASKAAKEQVFLTLFEFNVKHLNENDFITEKTLCEVSSCWQDALSTGDVILDDQLLLACRQTIAKYAKIKNLESVALDSLADLIVKFIICFSKAAADESKGHENIGAIISVISSANAIDHKTLQCLKDFCTLLESTKCQFSTGVTVLGENCLQAFDMQNIFKYSLFCMFMAKKLILNTSRKSPVGNDEKNCDVVQANVLRLWPSSLLTTVVDCFAISAAGESLLTKQLYPLDKTTKAYISQLGEAIKSFIANNTTPMVEEFVGHLLDEAKERQDISIIRALPFLMHSSKYAEFEENAAIVMAEDFSDLFVLQGAYKTYVCSLQHLMPKLAAKSLTMQNNIMKCETTEIWLEFAMFRCLIENNFSNVPVNDTVDKTIALAALQLVVNFAEKNQRTKNENMLFNTNVHDAQFEHVNNIVEYINLLTTLLTSFPHQLTLKHFDAVRLGLSSWMLSVTKSRAHFTDPKVFLFIVKVFHLYETFKRFVLAEKQKSSTAVIKSAIDEWENAFARATELVLFNCFTKLVETYDNDIDYSCFGILMQHIVPSIELINCDYVYSAHRDTDKLDMLYSFLLRNISHRCHCIRMCSVHVLKELTKYFVADDALILERTNEVLEDQGRFPGTHVLHNFDDYMVRYGMPITKYLEEFTFKLIEIADFSAIDRDEALSYLLLWECVIYICAHAPLSLRSIYTNWLNENNYQDNYLHFLFRCMPVEILKNHDSKIMSNDLFKRLTVAQLKEPTLSMEHLACYLYAKTLRKLPAIVRKWWNACPSRQNTFVDKLTTNFVSSLICSEELKAITNQTDKHKNMQINVQSSTREIIAVYAIDEVRMELVITLAHNYPLGSVKVDCGKQLGGPASSWNIGMQLSIFLTHQNGTICDSLTLWKNDLDKKFDGVEECFICYTVIHHETLRLPKLSCKTCKKKFHGPCLYKWFTTSSKSTCPICRNVF